MFIRGETSLVAALPLWVHPWLNALKFAAIRVIRVNAVFRPDALRNPTKAVNALRGGRVFAKFNTSDRANIAVAEDGHTPADVRQIVEVCARHPAQQRWKNRVREHAPRQPRLCRVSRV